MENLLRRINFLDVPVDSVDLESALKTIEAFLLDTHGHQIVFLTINKILKARRDLDLMRCIRQSDLVLPVSKGIIGGARFQKGASLDRYNLFAFTIRLLALAERLDQSVYLLGARKE
ncbi:MAG TPA: glycosyl transferase, partial [Spirochaetia bacterium]|nr:glycosyl transferase [Spirochaetia bacterium]